MAGRMARLPVKTALRYSCTRKVPIRMTRMTLASAALVTVFAAGPIAQTQTPPPPPPTGQTAQPPPARPQPPPLPTPQTPAKPPVPFPADAKIAFVSLNAIVATSKLGKQGQEQMKTFVDKWQTDLTARQKAITDMENEVRIQAPLLQPAAVAEKNKQIDQMKRDLQYKQNDFQAEVGAFNQQLVQGLEAKVLPILDAIRTEKSLWVIFADQGSDQNGAAGLSVVSINPGLDLTAEVIKRLDAATPAATVAKAGG
jgi:Skp family chaperone for outer membrane proteins